MKATATRRTSPRGLCPGVQDESTDMGVPAHHRLRTILVGTLVKLDSNHPQRMRTQGFGRAHDQRALFGFVITKGPNMQVLAYTWGLGEVLWAMLVFFFAICAIFLFIWVVIDIFERVDIGGWGKAGWLLLVFVLPVIGILIYLIARPPQPGEPL